MDLGYCLLLPGPELSVDDCDLAACGGGGGICPDSSEIDITFDLDSVKSRALLAFVLSLPLIVKQRQSNIRADLVLVSSV